MDLFYKRLREEISASFCFSWYSSHLQANCCSFSCGVAQHSGMIRLVEADCLSNVSSVLTLQRWKPPQSFAGGCWGSESCSRRRRGKSCAPGHKMPCHYSSWMRNSEYPHAEKKQNQNRGGDKLWKHSQSRSIWLAEGSVADIKR